MNGSSLDLGSKDKDLLILKCKNQNQIRIVLGPFTLERNNRQHTQNKLSETHTEVLN